MWLFSFDKNIVFIISLGWHVMEILIWEIAHSEKITKPSKTFE
jgi:hypothetical protein